MSEVADTLEMLPTMNRYFFFFSSFLVTLFHYCSCSRELWLLELPDLVRGPESIAFDCRGEGPYVGVSDGRILKWAGTDLQWIEFATNSPHWDRGVCYGSTDPDLEPYCGRPLGLKFNMRTCELYIADAYFGLLLLPPNATVAKQLASSAEGLPFRFTNAVEVDPKTGVVYFTDSSAIYQRREYPLIGLTGDRTGRLMKYDPRSKKVTVLLRGLAFANGLALSKDKSFLLVVEGAALRILKLGLKSGTKKAFQPTLFASVPQAPDNIKTTNEGHFWVGLNTGRRICLADDVVEGASDPVGLKLNKRGRVLKELDGHHGETLDSVSEVVEQHDGLLYIGSVTKPYLAITKN